MEENMSVIGHSEIINSFIRAINNNRLSHAHIFVGDDGIGKSPLAAFLGRKLLHKEEDRDFVDIVHWRVEKNKLSIGVGAIRSLIEEVNKRPFEGEKKVIIIHQGDKMTIQAQNALLKTIEEPPRNVFIFILCENLQSILDTIKSRCQVHKLNPLKDNEIKVYLKNHYPDLKDKDITMIISFSDGIPGKAGLLINNQQFNEIRNLVIEILLNINNINTEELLKYEEHFSKFNDSWQDIINVLITFLRDTVIYKEIGDEKLIINIDKLELIKEFANMFSLSKLNDIISIVGETRETLERNVNLSLTFTVMLLKMQEV
jgi:DNA polymerase III subunit delta'